MTRYERGLFLVTLALCALGIVMVYSTTAIYAREHHGNALFFFQRALLFMTLGFCGLWVMRSLGAERLQRWALPGTLVALAVLILVLCLGHKAGGARRWFRLGMLSFQPIEIVKPLLVLYLADFLARRQLEIKSFKRAYLPAAGVVMLVLLLVLLQPDLGSAVLLTAVSGTLFFIAGIRLKYLGFTMLAAIPGLVALVLAAPYRVKRLFAYFNPWQEPQGFGFQTIQSFLAFAVGGPWGVGLGESQQKLFFLPQAHTDFIYSIIGEELGFLGAAGVLILFGLFFWFGIRLSLESKNLFGSLLGIGVIMSIGLEALIHMAVAVGVIPAKGLPLPFISYGGSALVFHLICVGIVMGISKRESYA